jgi:hypothetical protein
MTKYILILAAALPALAASIPAGAEISVRTIETIRAHDVDESRFFPATIQRDVLDRDGHVAIPRGANAELVVRRLPDHDLALDLRAVNIDGKRYIVDTEDIVENGGEKDGVGENKRTGKFLGGGAAIGGIIGAIAGGGKGAAIGAASGAAAGAGAQMATRGKEVHVSAESVLFFRLERPVRITEYSEYQNRDRH